MPSTENKAQRRAEAIKRINESLKGADLELPNLNTIKDKDFQNVVILEFVADALDEVGDSKPVAKTIEPPKVVEPSKPQKKTTKSKK